MEESAKRRAAQAAPAALCEHGSAHLLAAPWAQDSLTPEPEASLAPSGEHSWWQSGAEALG